MNDLMCRSPGLILALLISSTSDYSSMLLELLMNDQILISWPHNYYKDFTFLLNINSSVSNCFSMLLESVVNDRICRSLAVFILYHMINFPRSQ